MWDKARCSRLATKDRRERRVRSGSLNRVTRPAGDNDIYARQVYDVWSTTHELRVGRRRRRRSKSAESSNVCPRISREIRVLALACPFVKARFPKFRTFLMSLRLIYERTRFIQSTIFLCTTTDLSVYI